MTKIRETIGSWVKCFTFGALVAVFCIINIMSGVPISGCSIFMISLIFLIEYGNYSYLATRFVESEGDLFILCGLFLLGCVSGYLMLSMLWNVPSYRLIEFAHGLIQHSQITPQMRGYIDGTSLCLMFLFIRSNNWKSIYYIGPIAIISGYLILSMIGA